MLYAVADIHGEIVELKYYMNHFNKGDTVVILGDAGLNFYNDSSDAKRKKQLSNHARRLGIDILVVRGNHDIRPEDIPTYYLVDYAGGKAYIEDAHPNLYFAQDGGYYHIEGKDVFTVGGAYSVDKLYRLDNHWPWFANEQLSLEEQDNIYNNLREDFNYDFIFTHTCPYDYRPMKDFLDYKIEEDFQTEAFLQKIHDKLQGKFGDWMCGHFHHSRLLTYNMRVVGMNEVVQAIWEN